MQYKDYYKIMGVKRDAPAEEIKRAYRKLARKYHPDVSKEAGAEEKFKELGEAYEVLKDAQKRAEYDQLGSQWKQGERFTPPPNWNTQGGFQQGGFSEADPNQFSDFFEALFGRGGFGQRAHTQRQFKQRGEDLHSKVLINLEDAYNGAVRMLQIPVTELTETGHVQTRQRTLRVKIPVGVTTGQQIRLTGQGGPGVGGGPQGDLYLEIELQEHPLYRVDGANTYLTLPVTPWEAALGATIAVPTLGGKVEVKIPADSQSGQKLRLKGRGLPAKTPGDQFVLLQIVVPKADTQAARDFYKKMAEEMPFNPRAKIGA